MGDFPAAHSMDSAWFAVDRDGHVAMFETHSAGAVPDKAATYGDWEDIGDHRAAFPAEALKQLAAAAGTDRGEARGGLVAELCRDFDYPDPVTLGIFVYECKEEWVATPYDRVAVPTRPLVVSQLPAPLRKLVTGLKLEKLAFASTERVQPFEHARCKNWQDEAAWLGTDGVVRPIPGREEEFEDQIEDLREIAEGEGLTIEGDAPAGCEWPRYFEYVGGSSRKFWEVSVEESTMTVRFGRIGSEGQVKEKEFESRSDALREAMKLIAEKTRKGYEEKRPAGGPA